MVRYDEVLQLRGHALDTLRPRAPSMRDLLPSVHVERSALRVAGIGLDLPRPAALRRPPLRRPPVALGVVRGSRQDDYRLAVRVQDTRLLESDILDGLRAQARGEVDVRYIGAAEPLAAPTPAELRGARRPLVPGSSIGTQHGETTGTLGGFVRRGDGPVALLSNNHVLADQDRAPSDAPIVQPGWDDGGREPGARVAVLEQVVRLTRTGVNLFDVATARLADGVEWSPETPDGELAGVRDPVLEEPVVKVGRTTGVTAGTVVAVETGPVTFGYAIGNIAFDGLVEVHGTGADRFADFGDSGSLVYSAADRHAVGMVFGVTRTGGRNGAGVTYVNPLPAVLGRLEARLLLRG